MKRKLVIKKTFKPGAYVPPKEEVITLINKAEVKVEIVSQARYDNKEEELVIRITHP